MDTSWREAHAALNSSRSHAGISLIEDRLAALMPGHDLNLTGIPDDMEAVEALMSCLLPTAEVTLKYSPSKGAWTALLIDEEGGYSGQAAGDTAGIALLGATVCVMADLESRDQAEGTAAVLHDVPDAPALPGHPADHGAKS